MLDKYPFIKFPGELYQFLIQTAERYNEPHRYYHNASHLQELLDEIAAAEYSSEEYRIAMALVAIFHDAVYDPRKKENEEYSAELASVFFEAAANVEKSFGVELKIGIKMRKDVVRAILDTKKHHLAEGSLSRDFCLLDLKRMLHSSPGELLKHELNIFKEYQFVDFATYKKHRVDFLRSFVEHSPSIKDKIEYHIAWLEAWRPKIGIYAGSFNPFHIGHLDVLEKAEKVFDKVVVARGINAQKMRVPSCERVIKPFGEVEWLEIKNTNLDKILPFHETVFFTTLLSDVVKHYRAMGCDVTVIRGLRNGFDLQAESNLVAVLQDIEPSCNFIYIPCASNLAHVSSSVIRELSAFDSSGYRYLVKKYEYSAKP